MQLKRKTSVYGLFLVILVLLSRYFDANDQRSYPIPVQDTPTPTIGIPPTRDALDDATLSGILQEVIVKRIVDGDTIVLENGQKVRYIGIDTPESVDPRRGVQCFGKEASARNKTLVEGKSVRLEKDVSEVDRYGRLLRYVYLGDIMVNEALVREGFAYASSYPPDVAYDERLRSAETLAKIAQAGLWGSCIR